MPGDSSEWFAVGHKTDQFQVPTRTNVMVFTHPEVTTLLRDDVLPPELCEITSAPQEHWTRHHASISSCDLVFVPIPDDGAQSRQIVHAISQLTEKLPARPKILAYRSGTALRGAWLSLGATDVICFPQDQERLLNYLRRAIQENAQKQPVNVTAPETFNPAPLRRSLEENRTDAQDLVETFIGHMPEWLLELEEHLEEGNRTGILKVAGLLSSHAMSIGAERIVEICRTLCHFPSTYDAAHASHWVEELEREYKKLFQELVSVRRR